jgi:pimeloyl-ACP methyl ester carboxylesterase
VLGHGFSDKPRADYSVGGFANGLRDLLTVLDIERVTVVGHSLGAIVAMQFAYQFPERTERLVLVSAGGVSRSINPIVRAATLPFAPTMMGLLDLPGLRHRLAGVATAVARVGLEGTDDTDDLLRVLEGLTSREARMALTRTLRAVVDARGQVVTGVDRSYLAADLASLVVWGDRDPLIPAYHARLAHAAFPGSRLELIHGAGHFPHRSHAARFVATVRSFIAETTPRRWDEDAWRELLLSGDPGAGPPSAVGPASAAAT